MIEVENTTYNRADDEINVAKDWPTLPAEPEFSPLPGRAAVLMCSPLEDLNGIILTDRTGGNLRADGGVLAAVNDIPLPVGAKVYLRPYVGMHVDTEDGEYRLIGVEVFDGDEKATKVHWSDHVLCTHEDKILPTEGNLIVLRDRIKSEIVTVKSLFTDTAIVLEGSMKGERVILKPNCETLSFRLSDFKGGTFLVKESDVLTIIEGAE